MMGMIALWGREWGGMGVGIRKYGCGVTRMEDVTKRVKLPWGLGCHVRVSFLGNVLVDGYIYIYQRMPRLRYRAI